MARSGKPCNRDGCNGLRNLDNGCTNPSCVQNRFNRKRRAEELHAERDVRARHHQEQHNDDSSAPISLAARLGDVIGTEVDPDRHEQINPYNFAKALSDYKPHGSSTSASHSLGTFIVDDGSDVPTMNQSSLAADQQHNAIKESARRCAERFESFARFAASWANMAEDDARRLRESLDMCQEEPGHR